jgi:hypothetical protein
VIETEPEFHECTACYEEAVFLHRYDFAEYTFCDKHSLRELGRDLHRVQRGNHPWVNDLIEVVLIP